MCDLVCGMVVQRIHLARVNGGRSSRKLQKPAGPHNLLLLSQRLATEQKEQSQHGAVEPHSSECLHLTVGLVQPHWDAISTPP